MTIVGVVSARTGFCRTAGRTMLVHVVGGMGVGAAAGFPVPPLSTALGALTGGALGAVAGALAVGVVAAFRPRAERMVPASMRIIFMAPTLGLVVLSAAVALSLLWEQFVAPSGYDLQRAMIAVFALPVVPAPVLMYVAAGWCLEPSFARLRAKDNGRQVLWAALPIPIAMVVLPAAFFVLTG